MVEIILFGGAGFLAAMLLALLVTPLITGRAVTKALNKLKSTMPLTVAEMTAQKDQLRAEHAVALRKLEIDLARQSERTAKQDIEIRQMSEKLYGSQKIGKANKLAADEMRATQQDLNERLRRRDTDYAGLEARARQMLREIKDLKLKLAQKEKEVDEHESSEAAKKPSAIEIVSPAGSGGKQDALIADLQRKVMERETENIKARETITRLREEIAHVKTTNGATSDTTDKPRLPKAELPEDLGGQAPIAAKNLAVDNEAREQLKTRLFALAADMARITALLEGDQSKVHEILASSTDERPQALSHLMKSALDETRTRAVAKTANLANVEPTPPKQPKAKSVRAKTTVKKKTASPRLPKADAFELPGEPDAREKPVKDNSDQKKPETRTAKADA